MRLLGQLPNRTPAVSSNRTKILRDRSWSANVPPLGTGCGGVSPGETTKRYPNNVVTGLPLSATVKGRMLGE